MRSTPVAICLLLAFGCQPSAAAQFVTYKVCHGEKREVCSQHPDFDQFEGCTNSTSGEQGKAKPEYTCERFCGVSPAKPGLCAVVPPAIRVQCGT